MEEREDLLSILREHRPYYFWVLVAQMLVSGAAITWWEVVYGGHASGIGVAIAVGLKMSALIPLWGLITVIVVDIRRRIVVLLPDGRAKIRAEGIVIGEARGEARVRAEAAREFERLRAAWAAWYVRWEDAKEKGEPFDEPPPDGYLNGASGNNSASGSDGE